MKFKLIKECSDVRGHVRAAHIEVTVEADSKEEALLMYNSDPGFYQQQMVVKADDVEIEDWDISDEEEVSVEEVK